jgi:5-methylcytosine-specific restriction endonuclease McrA
LPYQEVVLTRKNILLRDNYTCQYCGKKTQLTIDHVLPRSRGGRDIWTNVVVACQRCNHNKGHQTVLEASMHLKAQPYKPPSALYLELTRYKNVPGSWIKYFHQRQHTDTAIATP